MKKVILQVRKEGLPDVINQHLGDFGDVYIEKTLSDEQKTEIYKKAEIYVTTGSTKVDAERLAQMPNLKLIANCGVGYDGIDVNAAHAVGVEVTNTPNVLNDDVADVAIALLLNTVRRFVDSQKYIEQGKWQRGPFPLTRSIVGLKVGIVGLGRIGSEVALRLKAFKTEIAYYSRHKKDAPYTYFANLKDLATWADALILVLPATKDTYHLINDEILDALGNGYLINIARGSIVDTEALINALQSGKLAGAGLDVFEKEPQVPYDLQDIANVVITPHVGSATQHTRFLMGDLVLKNIKAYLDGNKLITPV